jgi:hypothetical protein
MSLKEYDGSMYKKNYNGIPQYNGVEYDWEVPNNMVIGSPGGVSTIHHHYTRGFDGIGNSSSDVFAGQGQSYGSGVYGNLYSTGENAFNIVNNKDSEDYKYWNNQEPQQSWYNNSVANTFPSKEKYKSQSKPKNYEIIENDEPYKKPENYESNEKYNMTLLSFVAITAFFITMFFWYNATKDFSYSFFKDKNPNTKQQFIIAALSTSIFFIIYYFAK